MCQQLWSALQCAANSEQIQDHKSGVETICLLTQGVLYTPLTIKSGTFKKGGFKLHLGGIAPQLNVFSKVVVYLLLMVTTPKL